MYTVAKATQGLADYINSMKADADTLRSVAIAYDSRHMSTEFADISAAVLNANGIRAYVFDSLRPTPELSFAVRYLKCIAGINVTASHNPAKYNGYKVYWEDGAQVSEPFDQEIMACVNKITDMLSPKLMPKDEAVAKGLYVQIGEDVDNAYMDAVCTTIKDAELIKNKGKDISVVYTPLHGAGIKIVPKLLERVGFTNVHIVKEQAVPDGDFPTVEFPNPEITDALKLAHDLAVQVNADLVLGTDPDSDRMGVMVRDADGNFHNLTGNLIGCILCEYLMKKMKTSGQMPKDGYIIRSIVSSQLADQVAAEYGAELREVLTGFKWIGRNILESEKAGKGTFIFGFEESCG
jgi:phosphoglucomutase